MTQQEKLEKKRKAAAERQRKCRAKKKAWQKARGAEELNMKIYRGTAKCLQSLMDELDYKEQAELITRLIHGAHRLLECDRSQVEELLSVTEVQSCS